MQDLHSIAGAMGFVFGSAAVSASSSTGYRRSGGFRTPPPPPPPPPPQQQPLKCPRCDSTNTKFCYYNNYNLSQPRHFCKSCRRYWTRGGVLRNVPVGGASRKPSSKKPSPSPSSFSSSKKPSSISPSSSRSSASIPNRIDPQNPIPNPSFNPMGFSDGFAGILGSSVNRGVLVFGGGSDPAPITADELGIAGIADRNAHVDLISFQSGRTSGLAINGGDSDPGLIDLMSTVDRGSYWSNQSNPWGVTDSNIFFP